MLPWIEKQFGSVEATREQKIIKVTNNVTLEGVLFNWLRSSRPMWRQEIDLDSELEADAADPLADPYNGTPEDLFGRVRGQVLRHREQHRQVRRLPRPRRLQRAAPAALHARDAARLHRHRRPLGRPRARVRPGGEVLHLPLELPVARRRVAAARPRAGDHGPRHALRRGRVPAPRAAVYQAHHRANYFNDLYLAHESLGCAFEKDGTKVIANLTPKKENEVMLFAPFVTTSLKDRIYEVLECYPRPHGRHVVQPRDLHAAVVGDAGVVGGLPGRSCASSTAATRRRARPTSARWSCTRRASSPAIRSRWRAPCASRWARSVPSRVLERYFAQEYLTPGARETVDLARAHFGLDVRHAASSRSHPAKARRP